MNIQLKKATLDDIEAILALHYKYQTDSIAENDKADGFITTAFSKALLAKLILKEKGLFIASINNRIVAYAMAASWSFCSQWPMFEYMIKQLNDSTYQEQEITINNSYQYGPICVDKSVRGKGVFEQLFYFSLQQMAPKYPIMVTFINKINSRSLAAHTRKTDLLVIKDFQFNNNHYFKLAGQTASKLKCK